MTSLLTSQNLGGAKGSKREKVRGPRLWQRVWFCNFEPAQMAPVLVTIETSGERGEIKPKTPSRTFLTLSAPHIQGKVGQVTRRGRPWR
jgi:hypothetical protein